jgi:VIT1/CCC1 family predicted Fe2+/Mn2+ transporter
MKHVRVLGFVVSMVACFALAACAKMERSAPMQSNLSAAAAPGAAKESDSNGPTERKIIRRAELSIESSDPPAAQKKATELAEKLGGFVVSSDVHHSGDVGGDGEYVTVSLVLRVPADRFAAALDELRRVGTHVSQEKVTGQDVTEEYVDVEARIRTQKALESQLLEIMKDAKTVKDALEVQKQLAEVRGEIEKVEGRKKLLDNQTSLATISVTIGKNMPVVSSSSFGFGDSVKRAGGDFVKVTSGLVNGTIRAIGALAPVALFVLLPGYFLVRFVIRRARRRRAKA